MSKNMESSSDTNETDEEMMTAGNVSNCKVAENRNKDLHF
jgi:hypothetical protein